MEPEFPPNSEVSKNQAAQGEDKHIERVTSGEAIRKKRSLRRRFSESFVTGDAKSVFRFVVMDVVLPAAQDLVVDAISSAAEKLFKGESRRYRGITRPQSGPTGYVSYNQYAGPMGTTRASSFQAPYQRAMSRQARARHDFDEILLDSRTEAEQVIDQLFDIVEKYDAATVADLYELVGLASNHTDHKWGWTDIRGAGVSRTRDGYLLDLPEPIPLG
jgi:hypothetical protein